jgi:hypothetical protein
MQFCPYFWNSSEIEASQEEVKDHTDLANRARMHFPKFSVVYIFSLRRNLHTKCNNFTVPFKNCLFARFTD